MSDADPVSGTPASPPSTIESNVASVEQSLLSKLTGALNGAATNGTQPHAEPSFATPSVQAGQPPSADLTAAPAQATAATEPPNAAAADTRPRDEQGRFLPATPAEPEIEFGEYGKVKVSEIPALHQQLIEFERNQAAIRYQETEAKRLAAESQAQARAQELEQYRQSEAYLVQLASQDQQAAIDLLTNRAIQAGYAQSQQAAQLGQPQRQAQSPEQIREIVAQQVQAHLAEVQAKQAQDAARQQHFAQVDQQFNQLIDSAIPTEQYGAFRPRMVDAVKSMVRDAKPGTFVPGMPIPLVMRKIANFVNAVKADANSFLAGRKAQQAAITGNVAPQPQGGTMIPKTEKPPYKPFDEGEFAASFANRFKEHLTGL